MRIPGVVERLAVPVTIILIGARIKLAAEPSALCGRTTVLTTFEPIPCKQVVSVIVAEVPIEVASMFFAPPEAVIWQWSIMAPDPMLKAALPTFQLQPNILPVRLPPQDEVVWTSVQLVNMPLALLAPPTLLLPNE